MRLRNKGNDAYMHSEYGDAVIVERRISKEGVSSLKLKDATGMHIAGFRMLIKCRQESGVY